MSTDDIKPEFFIQTMNLEDTTITASKIMVVEDEVVVAMDICNQLEDLGYQIVASAVSGHQAIAEAAEHRPEIVIMDIILSGNMDGITASQTIINQLHIPVIFLTAYSDPTTVSRAKVAGATSYLIKPFRPNELHACIEVALYKHQLERKLKQSEQWFARTLHCINNGVIATDADGKIRFLNPIAEVLTATTFSQAEGKVVSGIMTLLTQTKRTLVENPISKALYTRSAIGMDSTTYLVTHSGNEIPVEHGAAPIIDDQGNLLGAVLVFRDITQRCLIENLLRESEEKFHSVFEMAATGMSLVAIDGRLLQINSSLSKIFGYSGEELVGLSLYSLSLDQENRKLLKRELQLMVSDAVPTFEIEMQGMHKNMDEHVCVLLSGSLVRNTANEPQYFIIQIHDITERKNFVNQLEYSVTKAELELKKCQDKSSEMNTTLNLFFKRRQSEKSEFLLNLCGYLDTSIIPFLKMMKGASANQIQATQLIGIIENNLQELVRSYGHDVDLPAVYRLLTPIEIQVASMIRQGLSTKIIAATTNSSTETISVHRKHIRKKLGLDKKNQNLRSYLLSLSE